MSLKELALKNIFPIHSLDLTTDLLSAVEFSVMAHSGQFRNDNKTPYVSHCIRVMRTVCFRTTDIETRLASPLHDTIEEASDAESMYQNILNKFGPNVAFCVKSLTNDMSLPKSSRIKQMIEKAKYFNNSAKIIKCADRIDNLTDALDSFSDDNLLKYFREAKLLASSLIYTDDPLIPRLKKEAAIACWYLATTISSVATVIKNQRKLEIPLE